MPSQNFKVHNFDVVSTRIDFEGGMLAYLHRSVPGTSLADEALCEKPDPQLFAFARGPLSSRVYMRGDNVHVAQSQCHDIDVAVDASR
ncbi:hypothetical protein [Polaromonas sp. C04]|uniref:hypothetical protein n=1 Tax=Polaromonas sp. C04 TaxID=1945857 RepID=UPI000987B4D0|nr:hypothetical protein [Polaromonas sp. C04]OOG53166.1 hypothetical protein B0E49_11890 [Polaromonas sp. C04]